MELNTLKPAKGSNKNRTIVGRGIACGKGKTCGRGHKGQSSRSGGYHKVGFEGGQMPIQRRLPKFGFRSYLSRITGEVRLSELHLIEGGVITIEALAKAGIIGANTKYAKIFASGNVETAVTVQGYGMRVTKGAAAAIIAAGGKVEV